MLKRSVNFKVASSAITDCVQHVHITIELQVGHIEDVVVDNSVRGQHLGLRIVEFLTTFAEEAGCYKVILDCSTENATFYEKCGLSIKGTQMAKYF